MKNQHFWHFHQNLCFSDMLKNVKFCEGATLGLKVFKSQAWPRREARSVYNFKNQNDCLLHDNKPNKWSHRLSSGKSKTTISNHPDLGFIEARTQRVSMIPWVMNGMRAKHRALNHLKTLYMSEIRVTIIDAISWRQMPFGKLNEHIADIAWSAWMCPTCWCQHWMREHVLVTFDVSHLLMSALNARTCIHESPLTCPRHWCQRWSSLSSLANAIHVTFDASHAPMSPLKFDQIQEHRLNLTITTGVSHLQPAPRKGNQRRQHSTPNQHKAYPKRKQSDQRETARESRIDQKIKNQTQQCCQTKHYYTFQPVFQSWGNWIKQIFDQNVWKRGYRKCWLHMFTHYHVMHNQNCWAIYLIKRWLFADYTELNWQWNMIQLLVTWLALEEYARRLHMLLNSSLNTLFLKNQLQQIKQANYKHTENVLNHHRQVWRGMMREALIRWSL